MKQRYTVLGLSIFLALALAVPALGGPTNPIASISSSAKSIANKALKKAKTAQSAANTANGTANTALTEAKKAQTTASTAETTANSAKTAATAAQTTANSAKAAAEAANANANNRIKESVEVIGKANPPTGTNTETSKTAGAECEPGQFVLGGGYFINGESNAVTATSSEPALLYGNGWAATGEAISGTPTWSIQADVMCGVK